MRPHFSSREIMMILLRCISINTSSWPQRGKSTRLTKVEREPSTTTVFESVLLMKDSSRKLLINQREKISRIIFMCLLMRNTFLSGHGIWRRLAKSHENRKK